VGKTYPKVLELLEKEVPLKKSRNQFCRETGINPNSFDRYKAGISEPTTATLEKLGVYFGVSVAWLRGEDEDGKIQQIAKKIEQVTGDDMLMMVVKSLFLGKDEAVNILGKTGFTSEEAAIFAESIGDRFAKKFLPDMLETLHITIFKPLIDETLKISQNMTAKNEKKFVTMLKNIGSNLELEVLKPTLNELALLPASELPAIAAIIKRFRENEQFNLDARKLLNSNIAHSKSVISPHVLQMRI
jgi:transcriptional regulator with XRE-family HTH domain